MSKEKCQEEYVRRIHKVQDYIEHHLEKYMSIEELSKAAGFSKYHFSRIFQGILHESLAHYVNRIRMEKALFLLAHRADKNMTDIAYDLGYTDSSIFSRAFKNYYGYSPREYRKEYSKNCKDSFLLSEYNKATAKREWKRDMLPVTGEIITRNLDKKKVAYVRHIGTYDALEKEYPNLINILFTYAKNQRFLLDGENLFFAMYHDNPEFVEKNKFRTSLCLTVPDNIDILEDGILGSMNLEEGLYAVGHFEIHKEQYSDAWNYMYQKWLTGSGYVPRNSYPFEVYLNDPHISENHIHKVEIYVPIEPILF